MGTGLAAGFLGTMLSHPAPPASYAGDAGCALPVGEMPLGRDDMTTKTTTATPAIIPPLDLEAPARTERALFALG